MCGAVNKRLLCGCAADLWRVLVITSITVWLSSVRIGGGPYSVVGVRAGTAQRRPEGEEATCSVGTGRGARRPNTRKPGPRHAPLPADARTTTLSASEAKSKDKHVSEDGSESTETDNSAAFMSVHRQKRDIAENASQLRTKHTRQRHIPP